MIHEPNLPGSFLLILEILSSRQKILKPDRKKDGIAEWGESA